MFLTRLLFVLTSAIFAVSKVQAFEIDYSASNAYTDYQPTDGQFDDGQSVFVNIVAAFFYAAFFNFSFGLSGLRVMIPGRSQFLVSPHQRDGLAALAWR